MSSFIININEIVRELEKIGARRIFLQMPEGLKKRAASIIQTLQNKGYGVVVDAEPCFGSCDIPFYRAKHADCDVILHLGHVDFGIKGEIPVIYYPVFSNIDVVEILERNRSKWNDYKSFVLATTAQHLNTLSQVRKYLETKGKEIFTGHNSRNKIEGLIFGCDYSAVLPYLKKASAIMVIAGGKFHALGALKHTDNDVVSVDVDAGRVTILSGKDRDNIIRKEMLIFEKFQDAKNVGVLFSCKLGQLQEDPFKVKRILEKLGKNTILLAFDIISTEKMEGLELDFLVNLACPRVEDDLTFSRPIMSWRTLIKYLKIDDIH